MGLTDEPDDGRLGILIDVDCRDSPDAHVKAADTWFNAVLDRIGMDARHELSGFRAAPGSSITDTSNPWGVPGGRAGVLGRLRWSKARVVGRNTWYSDALFRRLPSRLTGGAYEVYLYVEALDSEGWPRDGIWTTQGDDSSFWVLAQVNEDAPGWLRLPSSVRLGALRRAPDLQRRWVDVITDMVDQHDVSFGYVGVVGTHDRTMWECATMPGPKFTWGNTEQSLSWLRGYGWLTVVPSTLADQLRSLEPPLAVTRTSQRGAVIMQACPDVLTFDRTIAEQVRRTVEPVLLPGEVNARSLLLNLGREQRGLSGTWTLGTV